MNYTIYFISIINYITRKRPEFASSVCNSMIKEDKSIVKKIEDIQQRATMVIKLRGMEYEEILEALGLITLHISSIRGDIIQI